MSTIIESRYLGTLIGFACGDYLGEPAEYCYVPQAIKEMFGSAGVQPRAWKRRDVVYPAGFYTDDTSQMLCLAQSLLEHGFDTEDQLLKYRKWFLEGYMAAIPERGAFGVGQQTFRILIDTNYKIPTKLSNVSRAGGNGALMRCMPVALYHLGDDESIKQHSIESAIVTHNNAIAAWSCVVINEFISWIITETVARDCLITTFFEKYETDCPSDIITMLRYISGNGTFIGNPTGYALNTLQIALESFLTTDNFRDAITKAIFFGGDTDTQAAVTGGIAGAFYGEAAIPENWRARLSRKDLIASTATKLFQHIDKK